MSMAARRRQWVDRLVQLAERWLPALTHWRREESLPIIIDRHRIYVLPSSFGIACMVLMAILVMGALNYDNNPALLLGFVLTSVGHSALLLGFLALRDLRLVAVDALPVHAGESLQLRLQFEAGSSRKRLGLRLDRGEQFAFLSMQDARRTDALIDIPTARRGRMQVGRIKLSMRRPMGLFVIWSWLHPRHSVLVYPAIEAHGPALPHSSSAGQAQPRRSPQEELRGLRDYRIGDPLRTVAWKRSAQTGHLMVREFESPSGRDTLLDWQALSGLDDEAKIRRLTRWLIEAERQGLRSELRLPDGSIGPDSGNLHLHRCLSRLALLPGANE